MALFKRGSKAQSGANGKPKTGAVPKGGYGSGGAPSRAQKMSTPKNAPAGGRKNAKSHKPKGGHGSYGKPSAGKPMGGFGTHGKPKVTAGDIGDDGMSTPSTPIPRDQKKGRFNLPKGKFTY